MGRRFVVWTVGGTRVQRNFARLSQRLRLEVEMGALRRRRGQLDHESEAHPSAPQSWVGEVAQPLRALPEPLAYRDVWWFGSEHAAVQKSVRTRMPRVCFD